jgi:hypothetical protein
MGKQSKAPPRIIMRIELLPPAKSRLEKTSEQFGLKQVATTSRLIEWFSKQNDVLQSSVLGLYPEDPRADVPTMILKEMAGDKRK